MREVHLMFTGGTWNIIEYWILGEGASIFFCTYLIFACNIDFFMAGCPLSILKKIWEMWDFSRRKYGTNIGFLGSF